MESTRPHLAIIDDEIAIRIALTRLFEVSGYNVSAYVCASEFLADIHENMPACLVVDFQMPKMTGLDLQLRLAQAGIDIPIVILTARDENWVRKRCIAAGALAIFVKPIRAKELLAVIKEVVKTPTAMQGQLVR